MAGLQEQLYAGLEPQDFPADGLAPAEQLTRIAQRVHGIVGEQYRLLHQELIGELQQSGIEWVGLADLSPAERSYVDALFVTSIYPVLTPLAIDPGHPFPHVHNKSLNIALLVERTHTNQLQELFAVVQVPSVLDRVVLLPGSPDRARFVLLEDVIAAHLGMLFGGFRVLGHTVFRVTRNTDLTIDEDDAEDLLQTIQENLRQRMRGDAVRLEISDAAEERFVQMLVGALDLQAEDVYRVAGPVDLTVLVALHKLDGFRALKDEPLVPGVPPAFASGADVFELIRSQDILVHHPFESFGCVVQFIDRAADDPQVLAIKQTLYRTSGASPIIRALERAAQNGKQVTALVELKARFDEENNIVWARSLEHAGVHVVYGVVGLKTHCKASLVVRREADGIRRYVHLATGNYNPTTARLYTDLGLFTASPEFGEDTSELFNLLTGYSQGRRWRKFLVAPARVTGADHRADRPRGPQRRTGAAGTDHRQDELAGRAERHRRPVPRRSRRRAHRSYGARDLLSPTGHPRPLREHPGHQHRRQLPGAQRGSSISRTAGAPEVFLGSADWMPRNFFRRVEVMFPIEDPRLKARLIDELLPVVLNDNVKARQLQADGTYTRVTRADGQDVLRSQAVFQSLARESARVAADSALRFVPIFGPAGAPPADEPASSNGASTGQRSKPPRVRSPRARKRPEPA